MSEEESTTLTSVEGGTEVTITAKVEAAGLFKMTEPVVARMANRQVETDIQNLKDLLEAQAEGVPGGGQKVLQSH
jgi:hypothetical protein